MDDAAQTAAPTFSLFGLRLPVRPTLAMVYATLALIADHYYNAAENFLPTPTYADRLRNAAYDHVVIYGLVPLLIVWLVFRQPLAGYNLRLGDWRMGLRLTLAAWIAAAPVLYFAGQAPDVRTFYDRYFLNSFDVMFTAVVELVGWEFFFRGFLLIVLWEVAGPYAVVLQAVPFAMAHVTKPPAEALSTIFGGVAFGWVAWRTKSFLYPFLIHLFIATFIVFVAVFWH
jgi:membrane protease YdiL (CAAX protease family)